MHLSAVGAVGCAFLSLSQGAAATWPPPAPQAPEASIPNPPITAVNPKDGAVMIFIPAGKFLMGSTPVQVQQAELALPAGDFTDEEPPRQVYLDGYWIYKNDVTVARYRKFCKATNHDMPAAPGWGWKDDQPIVNVTWDDAKAYCDWAGVALPTEAQWEKAARGTDGRIYPWGNTWDAAKAWCSVATPRTSTAPVGSIPAGASPYGCLDMSGNVCQWCADWYVATYYATAPGQNPTGPASGGYRVVRGGSWGSNSIPFFTGANRYGFFSPYYCCDYIGIRAALSITKIASGAAAPLAVLGQPLKK
jgi:formylglycine-generating enzyme required for sulfatase activity